MHDGEGNETRGKDANEVNVKNMNRNHITRIKQKKHWTMQRRKEQHLGLLMIQEMSKERQHLQTNGNICKTSMGIKD